VCGQVLVVLLVVPLLPVVVLRMLLRMLMVAPQAHHDHLNQ